MNISVDTQFRDGVAIVGVQGEVDVYTAPRLKEELTRLVEAGNARIVVAVGDVVYVDSSGLGVLIGALKRTRDAGGDLVVAAPNPRIARILSVTGLNAIFNVQDDVAQAVERLKQGE
jgi:anti-sigma B factor antagonist